MSRRTPVLDVGAYRPQPARCVIRPTPGWRFVMLGGSAYHIPGWRVIARGLWQLITRNPT